MNLRVIQLQSTCHHDLAGPELAEGLRYLKHLEKFSVDPRYFRDYLTPRGALQRHRPPELAFRVDDPLNLAVTELSNSCHFLNEIEIGVFSTLSQARYAMILSMLDIFLIVCWYQGMTEKITFARGIVKRLQR